MNNLNKIKNHRLNFLPKTSEKSSYSGFFNIFKNIHSCDVSLIAFEIFVANSAYYSRIAAVLLFEEKKWHFCLVIEEVNFVKIIFNALFN